MGLGFCRFDIAASPVRACGAYEGTDKRDDHRDEDAARVRQAPSRRLRRRRLRVMTVTLFPFAA
jgi:hypothetical protein